MNQKAYKQREKILRMYFSDDNLPEQLQREVQAWLVSDHHREEKNAIMRELFCETMGCGSISKEDVDWREEYFAKEECALRE